MRILSKNLIRGFDLFGCQERTLWKLLSPPPPLNWKILEQTIKWEKAGQDDSKFSVLNIKIQQKISLFVVDESVFLNFECLNQRIFQKNQGFNFCNQFFVWILRMFLSFLPLSQTKSQQTFLIWN